MAAKPKRERSIAVVDIGSNSVRLVIYRLSGKKHKLIYEYKAVCRLALNMLHTKPKLDRRGMRSTLNALRLFNRILRKRKPNKVLAIGTAAMRAVASTRAGRKFHRKAERALGHRIKIISGRREARLTAYGVISGLGSVKGVCGDLGGGSLELASISRGKVGHTVTLPLGSLTLIAESHHHALEAETLMHKHLARVPWLRKAKGKTFYPIGGSWRAVARVMMKKRGQKIRAVHGYAISAKLARRYAEAMVRQKPAKFRKMHKKIRHRADVIPYAAGVLAEIILRMQPARVVFSAHGVREGVMKPAVNVKKNG